MSKGNILFGLFVLVLLGVLLNSMALIHHRHVLRGTESCNQQDLNNNQEHVKHGFPLW